MGAWIEIMICLPSFETAESHPTMGAWIEIFSPSFIDMLSTCRTPRWVRGLKSPKF